MSNANVDFPDPETPEITVILFLLIDRDMFLRLANEEKNHIQALQSKIQFLQPAISRTGKNLRRVDVFINEELNGKVWEYQLMIWKEK